MDKAQIITIAVCDDEKAIREDIIRLIKSQGVDCYVDIYDSGHAVLSASKEYDIYFLDIQMEGIDGIETAQQIRKRHETHKQGDSIIIFVTALKEYMESAFDVKAFHYLVKPVDEIKFKAVFARAVSDCLKMKESVKANVLVKSGNDYHKVFLSDILFIESSDRKAIINTTTGTIESYGKIRDIEKILDDTFFRCHRCYIVNMEHITRYNATTIWLKNGNNISLAHKKYNEFVKTYLNFAKSGGLVNA